MLIMIIYCNNRKLTHSTLYFSLLLELQDRADQSVEAYETALSMMDTVQDITKVWSRLV